MTDLDAGFYVLVLRHITYRRSEEISSETDSERDEDTDCWHSCTEIVDLEIDQFTIGRPRQGIAPTSRMLYRFSDLIQSR